MFSSGKKARPENVQYASTYKIIVVGDTNVGKTSMLDRYVDNQVAEHYVSTIGCDYKRRTLLLGDELVLLAMWDTAGQERFRSLVQNYYHGAHGIIFTYDITRKQTFENLPLWIQEVNACVPLESSIRILIGNKCDLVDSRQVSAAEGKKFADQYEMQFFEVSAKSADNVERAFHSLVETVHTHFAAGRYQSKDSVSVRLSETQPEHQGAVSRRCCDCGFQHRKKPSATPSSSTDQKRKTSHEYKTVNADSLSPLLSNAETSDMIDEEIKA